MDVVSCEHSPFAGARKPGRGRQAVGFASFCFDRTLTVLLGVVAVQIALISIGGGVFDAFHRVMVEFAAMPGLFFLAGALHYSNLILILMVSGFVFMVGMANTKPSVPRRAD